MRFFLGSRSLGALVGLLFVIGAFFLFVSSRVDHPPSPQPRGSDSSLLSAATGHKDRENAVPEIPELGYINGQLFAVQLLRLDAQHQDLHRLLGKRNDRTGGLEYRTITGLGSGNRPSYQVIESDPENDLTFRGSLFTGVEANEDHIFSNVTDIDVFSVDLGLTTHTLRFASSK